ncbi:MAG TPA: AAA family ATPase [Candidatus Saccharimonadales bacterium]|nr:AAA family ATPase [Candidatus Saccharimonadales bacterium]
MSKLQIIGIGGTNGSGKDTVGHLLADKYGYFFVSVTDILRDELARRGLPPAREHMRELSAEWRREHGLGVLVDKAMQLYKEQTKQYKGVVMASLRNSGEVVRVHELGGTVVWVDADPRVRYERVQANLEARGAHRAVDDRKTFEQFLADEEIEMHHTGDAATLDMAAVKEGSDVVVRNDGSDLQQFEQQVKQALGL